MTNGASPYKYVFMYSDRIYLGISIFIHYRYIIIFSHYIQLNNGGSPTKLLAVSDKPVSNQQSSDNATRCGMLRHAAALSSWTHRCHDGFVNTWRNGSILVYNTSIYIYSCVNIYIYIYIYIYIKTKLYEYIHIYFMLMTKPPN